MVSLAFMVAHSFYGIFRKWEEKFKYTWYNFFAIISFALLRSSCFNLRVYFRLFCPKTIIQMPSLIRKEKITCEKIVVPKLQETLLYVTRRDVQLEHRIVPIVPISPQKPRTI